jgi:hypothetical protein
MTAWQEDEGEVEIKSKVKAKAKVEVEIEIEVIMPQMVQRTEIFVAISKTLNLQSRSAPKRWSGLME